MPAVTSSNVKRQLSIVIKKFKFEELENTVMPCFPELTWNEVQRKLARNHESFTVKSAIRFIEDVIDRANLKEEHLQARLLTLQAIDVSRHSKKKTWYGYVLRGSGEDIDCSEYKRLQDIMRKNFLLINMDMQVKVLMYKGITYICLKEVHKKGSMRLSMPTYFALFLGQNYLFCSKKTVSKNVMNTIVITIGYSSIKQANLMGRDLKSLMKLLWNKKQITVNAEHIKQQPIYTDAAPVTRNTGTDYTQCLQRRNYATQCFGANAPVLEALIINAPHQRWQHRELSEKLPDDIHIGWEFRSPNIASYITKLTEKKVLVTPLPPYIANLMIIGKNQLTIRRPSDKRSFNVT